MLCVCCFCCPWGAVTAYAQEEAQTREIWLALPSEFINEDGTIDLYLDTDNYIWTDDPSTYDEKITLEAEAGSPALVRAVIDSSMTYAITEGEYYYNKFSLTEDNVYGYSSGSFSLTLESLEGISVMEYGSEAITVPEDARVFLVGMDYYGVPWDSVNNGTIVYAYTDNRITNNGTLEGGFYEGYVENHGTITGGEFTYVIENYGTVTGGNFESDGWISEKTVIYNYEDGIVSNEVRAAANVVEPQTVTLNLTNLTHNAESLTTTLGEDYFVELTAAEGYAVPESITVTIGGQAVESGFSYYVAEDSRSAEVMIWDTAQTGPVVITAGG